MANSVKNFFERRKQKKILEGQIAERNETFQTDVHKANELIEALPEPMRRGPNARIEELRLMLNSSEVLHVKKDRQGCIDKLDQLLVETRHLLESLSEPGTTVTGSDPKQGIAALKIQLAQALKISKALGEVPLPYCLDEALQGAEQPIQAGDQASPSDVTQAIKSLAAVNSSQAALVGFATDWLSATDAEARARNSSPQGSQALFKPIESTWDRLSGQILTQWKVLTPPSEASALRESLSRAVESTKQARDALTEKRGAIVEQLDAIAARIQELSACPIFSLGNARLLYTNAKVALPKATNADALEAIADLLRQAGQELDTSESRVPKDQVKALKTYGEKRRKLLDQINAASSLRGATSDTAIKEVIEQARQDIRVADIMLSRAATAPDILKATEPLDDGLKRQVDKVVLKLSKELKKRVKADREALPEYERAFRALVQLRAEIAGIPGAHLVLQKFDALLGVVRVKEDGRPQGGFEAAIKAIKQANPQALRKQADEVANQFTNKTLSPQARDSLAKAKLELVEFERTFPPQQVADMREELARAAGSDNPKDQFDLLIARLKEATLARIKETGETREQLNEAVQELEQLVKEGLPEDEPALLAMRQHLQDINQLFDDRRVDAATQQVQEARLRIQQMGKDLKAEEETWQELSIELLSLKSDLQPFSQTWPPLDQLSRQTIESAEGLTGQAGKGYALRERIARGRRLVEETGPEVKRLAQEAGVAQLVKADEQDGGEDLKSYILLAKKLDAQWSQDATEALERQNGLDGALKQAGVVNGMASTQWAGQLDKLNLDWRKVLNACEPEEGSSPIVHLQKAFNELHPQLRTLCKALADAADPKAKAFEDALGLAKTNEAVAGYQKAYATANGLLQRLDTTKRQQQDFGVDLGPLHQRLGTFDAKSVTEKQATEWKRLAGELVKIEQSWREEQRKKKGPLRERASELKEQVRKKFLDRKSVYFAELFDDLTEQINDALAMLDTDDASLVAAAEIEIVRLRQIIEQAKGKGGKDAMTLDKVQKRIRDLSSVLNVGNTTMTRMPQTYAKLKKQLDDAIAVAKRRPPAEAMQGLDKLEQPILRAASTAKELQVRYDSFKLRRDAINKEFEALQKHAGTTLIGGRVEGFNKQFQTRLSAARGMARQEGRMEDAFGMLDKLSLELRQIASLSPDGARERLQELDQKAQADQREVRDLARTWLDTQQYWEKKLIPQIKKAVKARKDDETEVESLQAGVSGLGKTVKAYTDIVSNYPHEYLSANEAPDMKTVRDAFKQAYIRLGQFAKVAQRLRDGASSTNVELQKNLNMLETEWKVRTKAASDAVTRLDTSLKKLLAEVDTQDDQGTTFMLPKAKDDLGDAAKNVIGSLSLLLQRMSPTAFSGPLATLGRDGVPMTERRKAREVALRTVRQFSSDLVRNPVLQAVLDGVAKGLIDEDIRPQVSLLRAGLKKIELAILVGI